uniref:Putative secreted protein n=1 Tax=Ixodes ricinus TaxID=34613 RepID=A0A6B0ULB2_IXORI
MCNQNSSLLTKKKKLAVSTFTLLFLSAAANYGAEVTAGPHTCGCLQPEKPVFKAPFKLLRPRETRPVFRTGCVTAELVLRDRKRIKNRSGLSRSYSVVLGRTRSQECERAFSLLA